MQAHMSALRGATQVLHSAGRMLPSLPRPAATPCASLCSPALTTRLLAIVRVAGARHTACRASSSDSTATAATAAAHPTPAMAAAMEAHRAALAAAAAAGPPMEGRTYAPEISWDAEVQSYLEAALGAEQLRRVSAALARPPLATCLRVNTLRTTPQVGGRQVFEAWWLLLQLNTEHVLQGWAESSAAGGPCPQPCPTGKKVVWLLTSPCSIPSMPTGAAGAPARRSHARGSGAAAAAAGVRAPAGAAR